MSKNATKACIVSLLRALSLKLEVNVVSSGCIFITSKVWKAGENVAAGNCSGGTYQNWERIGDHTTAIDGIYERLLHSDLLDAAHIKAIDVVPPVDFRFLVLGILDAAKVESCPVGKNQAARFLRFHQNKYEWAFNAGGTGHHNRYTSHRSRATSTVWSMFS